MMDRPEPKIRQAMDNLIAAIPPPGPSGMSARDPRIEDYLDRVCAPLVGVVPYARRQELRAELAAHLAALIEGYQEMGSNSEAAAILALRQFGEPRAISRQWAREWTQREPMTGESPWPALIVGLVSFGVATLTALGGMHLITGLDLNRCPPGAVESALTMLALLSPVGAGLTVGLRARSRQSLGAFLALSAWLLPTAVVALSAASPTDIRPGNSVEVYCYNLAIVQTIVWMPVGCAAAAFGSRLRSRLALKPRRWVLQ